MMTFLMTPIISCLLLIDPTVKQLDNYLHCKIVKHQVEVVQIWRPLIEEHFHQEDVIKALRIIYCESRGKENAVGSNKDGTKDKGLWQFNDNTWAWLKPKLKFTGNRFDPILSTKIAKWLIYNDGWYHWNSSKHCWGK